jgi:hypothetical protein
VIGYVDELFVIKSFVDLVQQHRSSSWRKNKQFIWLCLNNNNAWNFEKDYFEIEIYFNVGYRTKELLHRDALLSFRTFCLQWKTFNQISGLNAISLTWIVGCVLLSKKFPKLINLKSKGWKNLLVIINYSFCKCTMVERLPVLIFSTGFTNCINISAHRHSTYVHMYRKIGWDLLQNA